MSSIKAKNVNHPEHRENLKLEKYQIIREAILFALPTDQWMSFATLEDQVRDYLKNQAGAQGAFPQARFSALVHQSGATGFGGARRDRAPAQEIALAPAQVSVRTVSTAIDFSRRDFQRAIPDPPPLLKIQRRYKRIARNDDIFVIVVGGAFGKVERAGDHRMIVDDDDLVVHGISIAVLSNLQASAVQGWQLTPGGCAVALLKNALHR